MHKPLIALLLFCSSSAHADWTFFFEGSSGNKYYIDLETQKKTQGSSRAWTLWVLASPEKDGTKSAKVLQEADCDMGKVRFLSIITFSGLNGEGKVIYSSDAASNWQYPSPISTGSEVFKILCGKKP